MGKSSKAPDYRGAAEESAEASKWNTQYQTEANRPNTYTPWGSSEWQNQPGADGMPNWTNTINLSPEQQAALNDQQSIQAGRSDIAQGLMGNAANEMQTPQNFWNGLPQGGQTPNVPSYYGGNLPTMGQFPQTGDQQVQSGTGGGVMQGGGSPGQGMTGPGEQATDPTGPGRNDPATQQPVQDTPDRDFYQGGEAMLPGYGGMRPFSAAPTVQDPNALQQLDAGGAYQGQFGQQQYDRQMSLLGPQQEQATAALDTQLRNQGLRPGTEAYDRAEKKLRDQQGEERGRLSADAVRFGTDQQQQQFNREMAARQQGSGEQQQLYGQQLGQSQYGDQQRQQQYGELRDMQGMISGSQQAAFDRQMQQSQYADQQRQQLVGEQLAYGNQGFNQQMQQAQMQQQMRQQAMAEQMQREGWSLNKINAALSGQQIGMPSFPGQPNTTAGVSQTPNYLGAAQAQGEFQTANNPWNALGDIGAGLASNPGMFSDPRLKKDLTQIGSGTMPLYAWTWNEQAADIGLEGESVGYMATDVERYYPQHVFDDNETGYQKIDYLGLERDLSEVH